MKQQIRMRFPGRRAKTFTLSYDDGVEQDIKLTGLIWQLWIEQCG